MTLTTNRRTAMYIGVAAAAAAVGGFVGWQRQTLGGWSEHAAHALASAQFETPDGATIELAKLKGSPLVLNFWATWCPPCVEEMPLIEAFYRENHAKGWQVVGLAIDQPSRVRSFLAQSPVTYPIALAGMNGSEFGKILGNNDGSLPFTVVLDGQGRLLFRKIGKLSADEVRNWAS